MGTPNGEITLQELNVYFKRFNDPAWKTYMDCVRDGTMWLRPSNKGWAVLIKGARQGDGAAGRFILAVAGEMIKNGESLPDEVKDYIGEILIAISQSSVFPASDNYVVSKLNIKLLPGAKVDRRAEGITETLNVFFQALTETFGAEFPDGIDKKQLEFALKMTASKINVSKKTVKRRMKYGMDGLLMLFNEQFLPAYQKDKGLDT
ncbi:MAG: hypothetical protein JMN25_02410 [gamma proteobacterium endosymbiont of Lamellibrachia anaximandri]|nr:hypothetical protein [gamma proteobacterium endosymbiont of Lamellibrachia anaximandri]